MPEPFKKARAFQKKTKPFKKNQAFQKKTEPFKKPETVLGEREQLAGASSKHVGKSKFAAIRTGSSIETNTGSGFLSGSGANY